jgi:putative MATE family efflux protein
MGKKKEKIFQLTWPILVELLLTTLVGNVDQYMLSDHSQEAVYAVGNANQILYLLVILFNVVNLATMILASQYTASLQPKRTNTVYHLTVFINLIFGLIISLIIVVFGRNIFTFMKVHEDLMEMTLGYAYAVGGFIFFQGLHMGISAIFKTKKMMKTTMHISIAVNIFNIVFNYLLINGIGPIPTLGAVGAGIATTISRFVGLVIGIYFLYKKTDFRIKKKVLFPFPFLEFRKMLGIGLPSAGELISFSLSQTTILRVVNMFNYLYITNTKFYVSMFQWVSVIYSVSVAQVAQIIVSRAIGAGDIEEANNRIKKTWLFGMSIGVTMAVIVWFFSGNIVGLFTDDANTIDLAKKIFFVDIFLQFGKCTNVCLVRSLQATGDTKFPVMLGIVVMWIVAVGGSYLFGIVFHLGLVGVWIAMALDEIIRGICFLIRWRSGAWKKFDLVH